MEELKNYAMPIFMRTFSGKFVDPLDLNPEDINIFDIAHALSNICRFGGHCPIFYSVAQHSVLCSHMASPNNKLEALMHDASEAYLSDVPTPIKHRITNYYDIEDRAMRVISKKFDFGFPFTEETKHIDKMVLHLEFSNLFNYDLNNNIKIKSPQEAKNEFLSTYWTLTSKKM